MLRRDTLRGLLAALVTFTAAPALAQSDPIRIGLSLSLTGPTSPAGKQVLTGLEIWRDDVNAKGGLLGRQVQLVHYDDQGNPSNAPGIYAKLIGVDKVDLLVGPYSTNVIAAALPSIIQANRTTVGIFGLSANRVFKYPRYFSMNSQGPSSSNYSKCIFDIAAEQQQQSRYASRSPAPTSNTHVTRSKARARTPGQWDSGSSTTGCIRRRRRSSRQSCARSRRPIRTSCSVQRCRSTPQASSVPLAKSATSRR
jgi:hypothetical protein